VNVFQQSSKSSEESTSPGSFRRRKDMRAAVFRGAFDIRVEQIPDASLLEPTDAVVRITHACICGTDLWPYRGRRSV
jgi:D-arabinose 1-dehydrogenase-like Zn-dependent alcohol dehydrogenase